MATSNKKKFESHESAENYLEAILMLAMDNLPVRSVDIANMLGFSKASVSVAMKRFREEGKITMSEHGYIYLTDSGMKIAKSTYEKHVVLTNILVDLGVNAYVAGQDACRIEHVLSPETFQKIKQRYLDAHGGKSAEITKIEQFEQRHPDQVRQEPQAR